MARLTGKDCEKILAHWLDGKTTLASGATPWQKGDVRDHWGFRIELKSTTDAHYMFHPSLFSSIAKGVVLSPVVGVNFYDGNIMVRKNVYMVFREADFSQYLPSFRVVSSFTVEGNRWRMEEENLLELTRRWRRAVEAFFQKSGERFFAISLMDFEKELRPKKFRSASRR